MERCIAFIGRFVEQCAASQRLNLGARIYMDMSALYPSSFIVIGSVGEL